MLQTIFLTQETERQTLLPNVFLKEKQKNKNKKEKKKFLLAFELLWSLTASQRSLH